MSEELRSVLLGTAGLTLAAAIALILIVARGPLDASRVRLRAAVRLGMVALLLQAAHFAEELATGFPQRFPELLGLAPWSQRFFVPFNLFWLALWGLSLWGLSARRRAALFPLWFLGIACVVNGIVHPAIAIRTRGYFPGLLTSAFVGVAGAWLLRRLLLLTRRRNGIAGTAQVSGEA